ncbi:MAG TPA: hypothetical protein VM076_06075 [Gemmatimonadaceae bacterium]|nr:hypothetical protein [Gemmatimonadaceae bacterium]
MARCSSPTTLRARSTASLAPLVRFALAGALAVGACRERDASRSALPDSGVAKPSAGGISPGTLIRAAVAPDSARASELADSLGREGWDASTSRRASDNGTWPVNVRVPGDSTLGALATKALRDVGLDAAPVGSRPDDRGFSVGVVTVNGGTHGMSARVRWALSPDRRSLLVVEDPRSIENEPLPNAFVFAAEGAAPVQRDSVWDVMPSPDWKRVAYSRAYTTARGETDTIPPREWHRLAGQVGLIESDVRKHAFPTSGMATAYGVARPFIIDATRSDTAAFPVVGLAIAEGWRVGWSADGARLGIGAPPDVMGDDAAASRWRFVDPATGKDRGGADAGAIGKLQWTEGPNLDLSTAVDMKQRRAFRSGDLDVESEDGWIRVYVHDGARLKAPRIVGPGIALTATANGQFIVAITPDPDATSYDPPNHLVVYQIRRR